MLASTIPVPATRPVRPLVMVGVLLAVWLGVVIWLAGTGLFVTPIGEPPVALLTAVLLPVGVSVVAYASSAAVRNFVRSGDPVLLTSLQSWRILGGTFLVLLSFGVLPAAFALPAGWGDMAVGATAPFVAWAVAKWGWSRTGSLFVAWQVLGILDLVIAVGTGTMLRAFGNSTDAGRMLVMSALPLSVIPTFAVPLFLILHLASLAQYRAGVARSASGHG